MTPQNMVTLAGALLLVGGVGAPLFSRFFCTDPIPGWARQLRDVALAVAGGRLVGATTLDWPLDYAGALVYVALGVAQMAVFAFNWADAIGAHGARCRKR